MLTPFDFVFFEPVFGGRSFKRFPNAASVDACRKADYYVYSSQLTLPPMSWKSTSPRSFGISVFGISVFRRPSLRLW